MANSLEVIITCDASTNLWTCCVSDPHVGTNLMSYKGGGIASPRSLNIIGEDYIAVAEKNKPLLHLWQINSQQPRRPLLVLPGKASAVSFTRDGRFCVAGIGESVYVWQTASGTLLVILSRHYQPITALKFTDDGSHFVSAAEDGMVVVWSLAAVTAHPEIELASQRIAGQHDPLHTFSDNSLPITDICISKSGIKGRLFTVSVDRSCKIYDLSSGEMLLSLVFDSALTSVTLDQLELTVFVGTIDGPIYGFTLTNPPRSREHYVNTTSDVLLYDGHTKVVTCLSTSLNGSTLLSGSNDETVILWHIPSKQKLRTIQHKAPIMNAMFALTPPNMFKQDLTPSIFIHPLKKSLAKDTAMDEELHVLTSEGNDFWKETGESTPIEQNQQSNKVSNDKPSFVQSHRPPVGGPFRMENFAFDTTSDASLLSQIEKLQTINAELYKFAATKILNEVHRRKKNENIQKKEVPIVNKNARETNKNSTVKGRKIYFHNKHLLKLNENKRKK